MNCTHLHQTLNPRMRTEIRIYTYLHANPFIFFKEGTVLFRSNMNSFISLDYVFLKTHYSVNHLLSTLGIQNGRGRTVTFSLKNDTCASWASAEKNVQVPRQEKWIKDESLSHLERLYSPVAGEENKTDHQKLNLALLEISVALKNKALCNHKLGTGMLED